MAGCERERERVALIDNESQWAAWRGLAIIIIRIRLRACARARARAVDFARVIYARGAVYYTMSLQAPRFSAHFSLSLYITDTFRCDCSAAFAYIYNCGYPHARDLALHPRPLPPARAIGLSLAARSLRDRFRIIAAAELSVALERFARCAGDDRERSKRDRA